jgi:hypothetical protein
MPTSTRPAQSGDTPLLQCVEVAAGGQFTAIGYHEVAAHLPKNVEVLTAYASQHRLDPHDAAEHVDTGVGRRLVGPRDGRGWHWAWPLLLTCWVSGQHARSERCAVLTCLFCPCRGLQCGNH